MLPLPVVAEGTYRFEEYVLRMLIGSNNEEEVARRLGISAETVALIVEKQLKDDKKIDPVRVIKHGRVAGLEGRV